MYDELVKHLREPCQYENCVLCQEAANAIEDLELACNRYEKDYKDLCAYLPKWIPVTERLPEIRKVVLITDGIDVGTGWMNQGWWNTSFADIQRDAVTHWMPLPEPPEEGET